MLAASVASSSSRGGASQRESFGESFVGDSFDDDEESGERFSVGASSPTGSSDSDGDEDCSLEDGSEVSGSSNASDSDGSDETLGFDAQTRAAAALELGETPSGLSHTTAPSTPSSSSRSSSGWVRAVSEAVSQRLSVQPQDRF